MNALWVVLAVTIAIPGAHPPVVCQDLSAVLSPQPRPRLLEAPTVAIGRTSLMAAMPPGRAGSSDQPVVTPSFNVQK